MKLAAVKEEALDILDDTRALALKEALALLAELKLELAVALATALALEKDEVADKVEFELKFELALAEEDDPSRLDERLAPALAHDV